MYIETYISILFGAKPTKKVWSGETLACCVAQGTCGKSRNILSQKATWALERSIKIKDVFFFNRVGISAANVTPTPEIIINPWGYMEPQRTETCPIGVLTVVYNFATFNVKCYYYYYYYYYLYGQGIFKMLHIETR